MRFEYAVFDLDGTLIDTLEDLKDSVNVIMRKYGFPERSLPEIRAFVGNGLRRLIELSVPQLPSAGTNASGSSAPSAAALLPRPSVTGEAFERLFAEYKTYYAAHCMVKTAPYKGIPEAVRAIRDAGIRCAVVTNKMQSAAEEIIRSFFGDVFDVVIGQIDGMPQKPAPDGVRLAMERLGADPAKTVYIGDSEVDCLTARNARLPIIGVTWGFRDRAVLETNAADFVIDSPDGILPILIG